MEQNDELAPIENPTPKKVSQPKKIAGLRENRDTGSRGFAPELLGAYEIGIGLGTRRHGDEWGEADDLFSFFALDLSIQPRHWPVELTLRLNGASASDRPEFSSNQVERVDLAEIDLGLRIPIDLGGGVRAHIGGGAAWVEVTVSDDEFLYYEDADEVDDDDDLGWWAGAGIALPLGGGHGLGIDARWTEVDDLVLEGVDVDASGWTLLLSYSFRRSFH